MGDDEQGVKHDRSEAEERARITSRIVCICKGINLGRVLGVLEGCETVLDVNRRAGTGSGGCQGERCGPRIKILLRKKKEAATK
jgi:bacterioferritin-associated ferredoxin